MFEDEYEIEVCACGDCICTDCDYEINVSMFLFDVIEKMVARYRPDGGRLGVRVLALGRARQPEIEARTAALFDMLWPQGGR